MRHAKLTPDKFLLPHEVEATRARLHLLNECFSCYFELLFETGMRASEALNLERRDLIGNDRIFVRTLKFGVPRTVTVPALLYSRILKLCETGVPFPYSLRRADQMWRILRPVMKVPKSMHSIRHTVARDAYRATRDIRGVMQLLGHANISNTMIYLDVDSEEQISNVLNQMRGVS